MFFAIKGYALGLRLITDCLMKLCISAATLEKLLVSALLDDLASVYNYYLVGIFDC